MGYKTADIEHCNPCWVKDGYVHTRLYSGLVCSYKTGLPYDVEEQCNTFNSERVAFLLYHGNDMIVGRNDGTISIYDRNTGLLTGLNYFEYPFIYLQHIGFTNGPRRNRLYPIYIDGRDQKTVYCGKYLAFSDRGLLENLNMELAMACLKSKEYVPYDCYVYLDGGDLVEFSNWNLQTRYGQPDNGIDF